MLNTTNTAALLNTLNTYGAVEGPALDRLLLRLREEFFLSESNGSKPSVTTLARLIASSRALVRYELLADDYAEAEGTLSRVLACARALVA